MDIEKEAIYETDVLVMGTDGLWDVTSNEKVAETVQRTLEQFPAEDSARYRYRFTSAAQDLVMCSRGKLNERSWRTAENKSATIDDISVFVIPLAAYKEDFLRWKLEIESQTHTQLVRASDVPAKESTESVSTSVTAKPQEEVIEAAKINGTATVEEILLDQDPSFSNVKVVEDAAVTQGLPADASASRPDEPTESVAETSHSIVIESNRETDPDNQSPTNS